MIKYLLVIPSHSCDFVTMGGIRSLLQSDYGGKIVIVTPDTTARSSVDAIGGNGIDVIVTDRMYPPDGMIGRGITNKQKDLDDDTMILWMHNDIIYPSKWFYDMDNIIRELHNNIWCFTMPVYSLVPRGFDTQERCDASSTIISMWNTHSYNDMLEIAKPILPSYPKKFYREILVFGAPFFSGSCFKYSVYKEVLDRYGYNTYFLSEYLSILIGVERREWHILGNISPFIHVSSWDTISYNLFHMNNQGTTYPAYDMWFRLFGYNLSCFHQKYCNYTIGINEEKIVEAINNGNWHDIDYIFDDFKELLLVRDCNICPSKVSCGHVGYCNVSRK